MLEGEIPRLDEGEPNSLLYNSSTLFSQEDFNILSVTRLLIGVAYAKGVVFCLSPSTKIKSSLSEVIGSAATLSSNTKLEMITLGLR